MTKKLAFDGIIINYKIITYENIYFIFNVVVPHSGCNG